MSLHFHLGPSNKHTVYKGELIGLSLAIHLLTSLHFQFNSYTVIGTDNQAAIRALNNQRPHPGHYILDHIHDAVECLHRKRPLYKTQAILTSPLEMLLTSLSTGPLAMKSSHPMNMQMSLQNKLLKAALAPRDSSPHSSTLTLSQTASQPSTKPTSCYSTRSGRDVGRTHLDFPL